VSSLAVGGEQQDAKLTEAERKMVARLFSDPTYFPIEFRTWLKNYIEGAGINVSASQIRGGNNLRTGLPAGLFIICASVAAIPPDALQADGREVSRAVYSILFQKVGTSWGPGDGSTTFNIPDTRDRSVFGAGSFVGVGGSDAQPYGGRKGPVHHHGTHTHPLNKSGSVVKTGTVSFAQDIDVFNAVPGTGSTGTGTGDRNIVRAALSDGIGVSDTTSWSAVAAQVGASGGLQDSVNWVGAVYAITTGQTG
jgi:microcystin-dependent protein